MHTDKILSDLLLVALSQALRAQRLDVADHVLSAIEQLTDHDLATDDLAIAYSFLQPSSTN